MNEIPDNQGIILDFKKKRLIIPLKDEIGAIRASQLIAGMIHDGENDTAKTLWRMILNLEHLAQYNKLVIEQAKQVFEMLDADTDGVEH